jgi:acetyl-CoA carboxylase biotin carboxyl carrier protein
MSDQEATPTTPQATSDERPQQRTNQPEPQQQRERGDRPPQRERDRGRRRHPQQQNQPQPQQRERRPEPSLNMEELRELVELIAQYGFTDFELEREGIRVRLRRELAPQIIAHTTQPAAGAAPSTAATALHASVSTHAAPPGVQQGSPSSAPTARDAQAEAAIEEEGLHIITSPIVGTFYRAASPTSEPFVGLGSNVDPDTVVCIIEAMKLMNEIQAETHGEVAKIYVENGQPVEYGQPLFGIKK